MSKMTRCPQCQTTFRVTDAQLAAANGKVRCGSCLHVFLATENWVESEPAAPSTENTGKFQFDQSAIDDSNADGQKCAAGISVPALVIGNSADDACTPSHTH